MSTYYGLGLPHPENWLKAKVLQVDEEVLNHFYRPEQLSHLDGIYMSRLWKFFNALPVGPGQLEIQRKRTSTTMIRGGTIMKDSRRVPGHAMRPMDVAGTEKLRKNNLKRYEVHSNDLSRDDYSLQEKSDETRE